MENIPSPFADAPLYDAQYDTLTKDVRFYQKLAEKSQPPVLELGMGTGRIAKAILEKKIRLVGLDSCAPMLDQARKNLEPYKNLFSLSEGDFRKFKFDQTFGLIFASFNSLHYLDSKDDFVSVLNCVHRHLKPNGTFAFDLINQNSDTLKSCGTPFLRERFFDERSRQVCEVWENSTYDSGTQIKVQDWEYRWANGKIQNSSVRMFIYSSQEISKMLTKHGFRVMQCLGDFDGGNLSPISPKQIYVCAKE